MNFIILWSNPNKKFKNKIVKGAIIKKLTEEPKEIKSPNWLDKIKFKEILTIIDSNKFGHKNKIGEFKYIVIVKNIEKNKDKLFKEDEFYNFVIQPQQKIKKKIVKDATIKELIEEPKQKYKLIIMGVNIYYLKLIVILVSVF